MTTTRTTTVESDGRPTAAQAQAEFRAGGWDEVVILVRVRYRGRPAVYRNYRYKRTEKGVVRAAPIPKSERGERKNGRPVGVHNYKVRNLEVVMLVLRGMPVRKIAHKFNVSRQRVYEIMSQQGMKMSETIQAERGRWRGK